MDLVNLLGEIKMSNSERKKTLLSTDEREENDAFLGTMMSLPTTEDKQGQQLSDQAMNKIRQEVSKNKLSEIRNAIDDRSARKKYELRNEITDEFKRKNIVKTDIEISAEIDSRFAKWREIEIQSALQFEIDRKVRFQLRRLVREKEESKVKNSPSHLLSSASPRSMLESPLFSVDQLSKVNDDETKNLYELFIAKLDEEMVKAAVKKHISMMDEQIKKYDELIHDTSGNMKKMELKIPLKKLTEMKNSVSGVRDEIKNYQNKLSGIADDMKGLVATLSERKKQVAQFELKLGEMEREIKEEIPEKEKKLNKNIIKIKYLYDLQAAPLAIKKQELDGKLAILEDESKLFQSTMSQQESKLHKMASERENKFLSSIRGGRVPAQEELNLFEEMRKNEGMLSATKESLADVSDELEYVTDLLEGIQVNIHQLSETQGSLPVLTEIEVDGAVTEMELELPDDRTTSDYSDTLKNLVAKYEDIVIKEKTAVYKQKDGFPERKKQALQQCENLKKTCHDLVLEMEGLDKMRKDLPEKINIKQKKLIIGLDEADKLLGISTDKLKLEDRLELLQKQIDKQAKFFTDSEKMIDNARRNQKKLSDEQNYLTSNNNNNISVPRMEIVDAMNYVFKTSLEPDWNLYKSMKEKIDLLLRLHEKFDSSYDEGRDTLLALRQAIDSDYVAHFVKKEEDDINRKKLVVIHDVLFYHCENNAALIRKCFTNPRPIRSDQFSKLKDFQEMANSYLLVQEKGEGMFSSISSAKYTLYYISPEGVPSVTKGGIQDLRMNVDGMINEINKEPLKIVEECKQWSGLHPDSPLHPDILQEAIKDPEKLQMAMEGRTNGYQRGIGEIQKHFGDGVHSGNEFKMVMTRACHKPLFEVVQVFVKEDDPSKIPVPEKVKGKILRMNPGKSQDENWLATAIKEDIYQTMVDNTKAPTPSATHS